MPSDMLPLTTTQAKDLFLKALVGNNYSDRTVRAYLKDVEQFLEFVKSCRVDWDNPLHFTRVDIVEFFNSLAAKGITGVSRARKLAAVRSFFTVLHENTIIAGNPAETVKRAKKEEKEPAVLFRKRYSWVLLVSTPTRPRLTDKRRSYHRVASDLIQLLYPAERSVQVLANLSPIVVKAAATQHQATKYRPVYQSCNILSRLSRTLTKSIQMSVRAKSASSIPLWSATKSALLLLGGNKSPIRSLYAQTAQLT